MTSISTHHLALDGYQLHNVGQKLVSDITDHLIVAIEDILHKSGHRISFSSLSDFVSNYHLRIDPKLHTSLWSKNARKLSIYAPISGQCIRELTERILNFTDKQRILDIEGWNEPEIYFRIVRPNAESDISNWHTDAAFYSVTNGISRNIYKNWLKVWVPLWFEPDNNTLEIIPGSHLQEFKFSTCTTDKPRPVLEAGINRAYALRPVRNRGDVLVFSPFLLHGALNAGSETTRLSIEFALG